MIDMSPNPMEMEVIMVAFRSFHSTPAEYGEPNKADRAISMTMERTTQMSVLCIGVASGI
jgi:hypothetical protein